MADPWQTTRWLVSAPLLWGALTWADPPTGVRQPADTQKWVAQLSADDWKLRQHAEDRLIDLGDDALPRLTKLAAETKDDETRSRAQSAIARIEQNQITGKSLITMDLKDAPAAQAVAELARQARAPIPTDPSNLLAKSSKRVSLTVDHKPFWEVMQSLSAQTELEVAGITRHNREIGLGLTRGNVEWMEAPGVVSGPLFIRADRLSRISTSRLRPPRRVLEEFSIGLTVFAEPKLKVLDYSSTLLLKEVVDELGHSLIPPEDGWPANVEVFGNSREGGTSRWEVGATLHRPKGAGKRIARFQATATIQVQTRSAVLDVPLAGARNVQRVVGGVRMGVKAVDAAHCDLFVHRDGRNEPEWLALRVQLSAGEARLLDDQGQVVARSQPGLNVDESPDSQRMEIRFRFAREGVDDGMKESKKKTVSEATRLRWEFPTEVRELSAPFEFRDLPIP